MTELDTPSLSDRLAQEIRRVDGSHSLGAAALADALIPLELHAVRIEQEGQSDDR